jgi:hypothetical protein
MLSQAAMNPNHPAFGVDQQPIALYNIPIQWYVPCHLESLYSLGAQQRLSGGDEGNSRREVPIYRRLPGRLP